MSNWNIRLAEAMLHKGLKQADLKRRVKVSNATVSAWVSGDHKPRGENLLRLCRVLQISERWLMEGEHGDPPAHLEQVASTSPGPDTRGWVPVISWVQAGAWHEAEDHYMPGDGEDFLPCPASHGLRSYALRVEGDSMTATHGKSYPDGSIIYVDPDQVGGVVSGDRVIAKINGEDGVTFKVFIEESGRRFLRPLNPQYPIITDEFRVIGKVIGKWEPD